MNPKKPRRVVPGPGRGINVTGTVGPVEYSMEMPPAKSRIVRGPDGRLIAIPIPPPDVEPIPEKPADPAAGDTPG
jgi:hypothetical protein